MAVGALVAARGGHEPRPPTALSARVRGWGVALGCGVFALAGPLAAPTAAAARVAAEGRLAPALRPTPAASPRPQPAPIDPVLERFLARPDEPVVSYVGRWRLEGTNPRFGQTGFVTARTWLEPDAGFRYELVEQGGSGRVRARLVEVLEGERAAHASGAARRAGITPDNYVFEADGPVADGLYRLRLTPRRADGRLVEGAILVTAHDADLLRLEGRLARAPSFWTREVEVIRNYGRVAGQRVPLVHWSRARLRLAGDSYLRIDFEYERVNGYAVETKPAAPAAGPR